MGEKPLRSPGSSTPTGAVASGAALPSRFFAWSLLWLTGAYLLNVALTFWGGLPGAASLLGDEPAHWSAYLQAALFPGAIAAAAAQTWRAPQTPLRDDARRISDANAMFIRGCFWAVFLIGLADVAITFLRLHGFLEVLAGDSIERTMAHQAYRSLYLHAPLIILGFVVAARRSTLDFTWLALLVVSAEFLIVLMRAFYTYPSTYLADLARFWYSALFLIASAHTLLAEGHVRVDVFYAGLSRRGKGWVDAVGAILLGVVSAWTVLIFGTWGDASAITGPLLVFEKTEAEYGAYLKYLIAGLLGVFAASMTAQFMSQFLAAVADIRGDPPQDSEDGSPSAAI